MNNSSFVVYLSPDLNEDILLTAGEGLLNSLPPDMQGEVQILQERESSLIQRSQEEAYSAMAEALTFVGGVGSGSCSRSAAHYTGDGASNASGALSSSSKKRQRNGKMNVECDRSRIIYTPSSAEDEYGPFMTEISMKALINMFYLFSPF